MLQSISVLSTVANLSLGDPRRRMLLRRRMNLNVLHVRIVEVLVIKVSVYLAISLHVDVE